MQQYSLMIMVDHSLIVGLWGVVNNAGVNVVGDMETTPIDQINRCLSINLFGMIRVTQQVLPMKISIHKSLAILFILYAFYRPMYMYNKEF